MSKPPLIRFPAHLPRLAAPGRPDGVNIRCIWALYLRGMKRYFRLWVMTLGGPALTNLLYFMVFSLAAGGVLVVVGSLPLADYIMPGLIVLAMAMGSFAQPAYMILHDKMEGVITDELMAPMRPWERCFAHIAIGISAGMAQGVVVAALFAVVHPTLPHNFLFLLLMMMLCSWMMSGFGVLVGICCTRWEQLSATETFLVLPLVFLSGTFFARDSLPEPAYTLISYNPMFFAIDGVRFGYSGVAQIALERGVVSLILVSLILTMIAYFLIRCGYKMVD